MRNRVVVDFSDLTYKMLKFKSEKVGIPITKVVKNIVVNYLLQEKEIKK